MKIDKIWSILEKVFDPEIPVLSVVDLGVVKEIKFQNDKTEIYI
ncbi:MAG: iron-sulfur cluster assembly protein, partial [Saprospiraceae bacterium]